MEQLSDSATVFLGKLSAGELKASYDIEQYLKGDYTYEVPDFAALEHLMKAMKESGKAKGAGVPEGEAQEPGKAENSYEGHGIHVHMPKLPMKTLKEMIPAAGSAGTERKPVWLPLTRIQRSTGRG